MRLARRTVSEVPATARKVVSEMASMVAEDLVADKVMVTGPRGVGYDDPTAGRPDDYLGGRLSEYNYYNYIQASYWEFAHKHYAINYALGAYLARTYGGAPLFGHIIRNGSSGIGALEAGLAAQGHMVSFEDVLTDWAVATPKAPSRRTPIGMPIWAATRERSACASARSRGID